MSHTEKHVPARRLLVSFAHPDDESFGLGGTIAYYADKGAEVQLICATGGEAGEVAAEYLAGYDSITDLRLAELDCAANLLGIDHVHKLGYRDSGMMGTSANDHPESLWQADLDEVSGRIVEVIRRMKPQVVITFDPYGGYGHPDHIKIHQATIKAFHSAADPHQYPEQIEAGLTPYQPQKLYYAIFPRTFIRFAVALVRLMGRDPRRMGANGDVDYQAVLNATLPGHARLDLRRYYDLWQRANACHASQSGPGQAIPLPRFLARLLFGWQTFHRAYPVVADGSPRETDLFAGTE